MKNVSISVLFLLLFSFFAHGQDADQLINKCISSAGPDTKYIKDFRVQLGQSNSQGEYRYKANISLWKDMKYRFTLCCNDGAKSQLILKVQDDANKVVLLSYDPKTGKAYTSVDFICNKSGIYQLGFDFTNDQQGSGVGLISVIK